MVTFLVFAPAGVHVQLQEQLLNRDNSTVKPDKKFLELFAEVVGSQWPSLAVSLSLEEDEMEDTRGSCSQTNHAFTMLSRWASGGEDATFGKLCQILKTPSFFLNYK